jgi:(1->4)-alpha-D-glucan 1-alpha-D-glucosylmutase
VAQDPGTTAKAVRDELVVRFQQTCGPVMAKGLEDTAFYRWFRLASLNEVGGDPARVGIAVEELHSYEATQQEVWPTTMTTLSTHDTKRSEDVRARLGVLSEMPHEWASFVRTVRELAGPHRDALLDPTTEYLIWQTLVGTWPISADRLHAYLEKAVREAKVHTTWTSPDEAYEEAVHRFIDGVVADEHITAELERWAAETEPAVRAGVLGQKLLQLVVPGVPDVYQGTELVDLSLVDPDNRRPVDYAERRRRLTRLDGGAAPADLDDEKLLVVSRALRLRRDRPECFVGEEATYVPLATTTGNAVAVGRGDAEGVQVVAVLTRLAVSLAGYGGWHEHTVSLPDGSWRDLLSERTVEGGPARLADLLANRPVALLVRIAE